MTRNFLWVREFRDGLKVGRTLPKEEMGSVLPETGGVVTGFGHGKGTGDTIVGTQEVRKV